VPYRVDLRDGADDVFDRLVDLGAIDAVRADDGAIAAVMPDSVPPEQVASALAVGDLRVSPALGRDAGSVWIVSPRPIRIGRLQIVPPGLGSEPDDLRLIDGTAFGTGLHPTTALCLDALQEIVPFTALDAVLDVGTGSGVLALGALRLGVPRALGIDIDDEALRVAAVNARLNGLQERLSLACGGPEAVAGTWPLVLANVLAAPLIEMAPTLVRRVARHGRLVLSGIALSVEPDVERAYRRLAMRRVGRTSRDGWVALVLQASW
jgi:ribosomal protein L11 methyltransferase